MKKTLILGIIAGFTGAIIAIMINEYLSGNRLAGSQQDASPVSIVQPPVPDPVLIDSGNEVNPELKYSNDELINITVYDNTNWGVVNIRTEIEMQRGFFVERGIGAGSGWVLDKEGHIVTNFHVIQNSEEIEVTLHDGTSDNAEVVGIDPANDIALLKISVPADSLHPIELGDSDYLRVGQKAIAIGNPFGFERSMSAGIISSVNRSLESRDGRLIKSIIQVDAALNQGNSGGPLLNSQGQLIGMNTAIKSAGTESTAQNSGVGFAVPVNTIRRVIPQLKQNGRVIRASIGVAQAQPTKRGLILTELIPGGPSDQAGLKAVIQLNKYRYGNSVVTVKETKWNDADIILKVDGADVRTFDELLTAVEKKKPGQSVQLDVLRRGRKVQVTVSTVEER